MKVKSNKNKDIKVQEITKQLMDYASSFSPTIHIIMHMDSQWMHNGRTKTTFMYTTLLIVHTAHFSFCCIFFIVQCIEDK